jgi:hypothetical protein
MRLTGSLQKKYVSLCLRLVQRGEKEKHNEKDICQTGQIASYEK